MSTPLIERLRAGLSSPPCNADGTYTVGNCSPDVLMFEAAAEIERLTGINSALCRKTNAMTIQSARDAEEIERLRDELNLCCELKREYQQQAATERERCAAWLEREGRHDMAYGIRRAMHCGPNARLSGGPPGPSA